MTSSAARISFHMRWSIGMNTPERRFIGMLDCSCCFDTFDFCMLVVVSYDFSTFLNVLWRLFLFLPGFIHVAAWASGYHNPRERSVLQHGWYLDVNSILIKITSGSDLELCKPHNMSANFTVPPIMEEIAAVVLFTPRSGAKVRAECAFSSASSLPAGSIPPPRVRGGIEVLDTRTKGARWLRSGRRLERRRGRVLWPKARWPRSGQRLEGRRGRDPRPTREQLDEERCHDERVMEEIIKVVLSNSQDVPDQELRLCALATSPFF